MNAQNKTMNEYSNVVLNKTQALSKRASSRNDNSLNSR